MFVISNMNIFSINTFSNNIQFRANPNIILTKETVKTMSAKDILELSGKTLKNQDINIIRMMFLKISNFVKLIKSEYSYFKSNEFNFSANKIKETKTNKIKAQKIEKLLSAKIREEKKKRGFEINPDANNIIPIEYLILPEEETLHKQELKFFDLIVDKEDADKYKYQRAKHDRNISRQAYYQMLKLKKYRNKIEEIEHISVCNIDYDYIMKKRYNDFAEKILFSETKDELNQLQQKICDSNLIDWLKSDLLELINRKINLL